MIGSAYELDPATFVAVIVNKVLGIACVGVPEILPVFVSKLSPSGSCLSIEYDATKPVTVGLKVLIAVPVK